MDRTRVIYQAYPWRGGYSAVNFYQALYHQVPKPHRPRISRIEYASPGFIELALVEIVARTIRRIIKVICDSFGTINGTYNEIYKGIQDRKLMRINVRREELALTREQEEFAKKSLEQFADKWSSSTCRSCGKWQAATWPLSRFFCLCTDVLENWPSFNSEAR